MELAPALGENRAHLKSHWVHAAVWMTLVGCRFNFEPLATSDGSGDAGDAGDAPGDDGQPGVDAAIDAAIDGPGVSAWSVQMPAPTTNTLWGVYASSPSDVWVSGTVGTAVHFDGTSWSAPPNPATDTLLYFWGSGASDVWLVGRTCTAIHWTGATWAKAPTPGCTTADLFAIGGITNNLWAVGTSGTILKWNGASWTATTQGTRDFWSVWTTTANDVWLAGTMGTLLHWDGAGYTADGAAPNVTMASIWGTGAGEYWAVGAAGTIMHKVGAAGWAQVASPTTNFLYGVVGDMPTNVWAVGSAGTLLHYDGTSWTVASSPTAATLRNIQRVSGGGFRAVGDSGVVLIHP